MMNADEFFSVNYFLIFNQSFNTGNPASTVSLYSSFNGLLYTSDNGGRRPDQMLW